MRQAEVELDTREANRDMTPLSFENNMVVHEGRQIAIDSKREALLFLLLFLPDQVIFYHEANLTARRTSMLELVDRIDPCPNGHCKGQNWKRGSCKPRRARENIEEEWRSSLDKYHRPEIPL